MLVSHFSRPWRALFATGILAVALAAPAIANADTTPTPAIQPAYSRDATLTINSMSVVAKVIAKVDVSVVCQPFETIDWNTGETIVSTAGDASLNATILQAQGRTVAWGTGTSYGFAVCDGTTINHFEIPVTAAVAPWRTGAAVIGVTAAASDVVTYQDSDYVSSGAISIKLGR
jgi:hypothetical protein